MKILVIGDPHFKVSNTKQIDKMTEEILDIAKSQKPDLIVNLGDTLDRHENIHMTPLIRATEFLKELRKIARTVLIIGNHDRENKYDFLTNNHPFNSFKLWDRFTVVDKVKIIVSGGQKLLFVPYVEPGKFFKAIDSDPEYMNPRPDMIFCHQEFKGAKYGGVISETGDPWPTDYPYVVSGHIHDYQQVQENLLYIGTPIHHSFDGDPEKGIFMITLPQKTFVKYPLTVLKRSKNFKVNNFLNKLKEIENILATGAELKITLDGCAEDFKILSKTPEFIKIQKDAKIEHRDNSKVVKLPSQIIDTRKFLVKLKSQIDHDPGLVEAYNDIFMTT